MNCPLCNAGHTSMGRQTVGFACGSVFALVGTFPRTQMTEGPKCRPVCGVCGQALPHHVSHCAGVLKSRLGRAREVLRMADDDIRELLQVAKYNLRGQINTGEIIDKPNPPMLVHEAGIAASERVREAIRGELKA